MSQVQNTGGSERMGGVSVVSGAEAQVEHIRRRRIGRVEAEGGLKVQFWNRGNSPGFISKVITRVITSLQGKKGVKDRLIIVKGD